MTTRTAPKLNAVAYEAMTRTIFKSSGTLLAGVFATSFASILVAARTNDPRLIATAILVVAMGLLRILVMYGFRLVPNERKGGYRIRPWRTLYAVGAALVSACLGLHGLISIGLTTDAVSHMIILTTTLGYVAGIAGRNAGCPEVSLPQLWLAIAPVTAGLLMQNDASYAMMAGLMVLFALGLSQISLNINRTLVSSHHAAQEREAMAERFHVALSTMQHGFALFDAGARIEACSDSFYAMLGIVALEIPSPPHLDEIVDAGIRNGTFAVGLGPVRSELWKLVTTKVHRTMEMPLRDGRTLSLTASPKDGGGCVLVVDDVTERVRAAADLARMARFDAVTGLLNRQALNRALQDCASSGEPVAVLAIDLDRFKAVNDRWGHAVGDSLLRAVAARLEQAAPADAVASRLGGDEFVVLLRGLDPRRASARLAKDIVASIERPFSIEDREISVSASVGVAVGPTDGADAATLLRNADTALYRVKESGRCGWRPFDRAMDAEALARQSMEADLRHAIQEDQFEVHYQPQVDVETGRVTTCEALVRWRHPTRGLVPPVEFIAIAEETGLIDGIGRIVLDRACRDALAWPEHTTLAVNLSPVQFRRDLARMVRDTLKATGFPGHRLELEVTESLFLENRDDIQATFLRLATQGVVISLDDFGTGYSSLSYLRSFPFHKVKVDRSFVQGIEDGGEALAIIRAVTNLGRDLGLKVVVEGIETAAQMEAVSRLGCTGIQGYHCGRPMDAASASAFLDGDAETDRTLAA